MHVKFHPPPINESRWNSISNTWNKISEFRIIVIQINRKCSWKQENIYKSDNVIIFKFDTKQFESPKTFVTHESVELMCNCLCVSSMKLNSDWTCSVACKNQALDHLLLQNDTSQKIKNQKKSEKQAKINTGRKIRETNNASARSSWPYENDVETLADVHSLGCQMVFIEMQSLGDLRTIQRANDGWTSLKFSARA